MVGAGLVVGVLVVTAGVMEGPAAGAMAISVDMMWMGN